MSRIKHLLFDCDGVIVDTEYVAATKMCAALANEGVSIALEHYLRVHSGTTFSGILAHYFGDTMPEADRIRIMHTVEAQVAEAVKPVEGMKELIESLEINKSVVSNSSIATVKHSLKVSELTDEFANRIFSSEQVANAKPAPDLYLFAIDSLGLTPDEILVIEDSKTGVQAARTAGLQVIGFTGASHILPGHDKKLMELGAVATAADAKSLTTKIRLHL